MLTEASLLARCMGQVASVSFFFVAPLPPRRRASENRKKNYLGITSETLGAFVESLGRSISSARNLAERNGSTRHI